MPSCFRQVGGVTNGLRAKKIVEISECAQKSSVKSVRFVIDDVDSLLTYKAIKKEEPASPVIPKPVRTRSKTVGHKRNKASCVWSENVKL
ncbi:hypothetical protein QVD17_00037 [Tagetes erecta]|uniref:Uncharacterized protein n=1 Tax=Tagetes erecta TaxID=13708 RepID=A0AAD8L2L7_TARER|nr:hypothetical protein QVD17_00037 [Tagetes erecta]